MTGVVQTLVGYAGGDKERPSYRSIGDQSEAIQVVFDPSVVSYRELVELFWRSHRPSSQAWSTQYANICFYRNDEQRAIVEATKQRIEQQTGRPVKTAIKPAGTFWPAEDYHQKYRLRGEGALAEEIGTLYPRPEDFARSVAAMKINAFLAGCGDEQHFEAVLPRLGLSAEGQQLLRARYMTYHRH